MTIFPFIWKHNGSTPLRRDRTQVHVSITVLLLECGCPICPICMLMLHHLLTETNFESITWYLLI